MKPRSPPPPTSDRPVPHDVKRAIEHLRGAATAAALGGRVTTAELVRVCGVPERTLRTHFLAFVGCTPLAYLRRMRLAAAREALLEPDGEASVTAVATRLGFAHLGRFASDYRRCFGEPPSVTLGRGRAAAAERVAAERMAAAAATRGGAAAAARGQQPPPLPAVRRRAPSLVVLPFRAAAGSLEERLLSEGLAEQLAAALSQLRAAVSVRVAWPPPGRPEPTARELGARYCLAGRIARAPEGRVRVVARLLDLAEGGAHLWGDAYDGTTGDPFGLLDRVVAGVVHAVPPAVQGAEIERARRKPVRDLGAGDLVLRALPLVLAADPTSARRALGPLEEAMGIDPDDPAPVALAGWCRAQLVLYQAAPDPPGERARALHLAERAAALDPLGEPLVLTARASVTMMARRRDDAEALLARAQAMDPSFAWAWERSAWIYANYGEPEPALAQFRRAVSLKGPRAPIANCLAGVGTAHLGAGRYEEAAAWVRRALAENPGAVWLNRVLAPCYVALGQREAARAALDRLRRAYPGITVERIVAGLPHICDGRERGSDGPIPDGLTALGLPA